MLAVVDELWQDFVYWGGTHCSPWKGDERDATEIYKSDPALWMKRRRQLVWVSTLVWAPRHKLCIHHGVHLFSEMSTCCFQCQAVDITHYDKVSSILKIGSYG